MPKVNLVSLKSHRYGGENLKAGDAFSAPRAHARVLIAMKRARKAAAVPDPEPDDDSALAGNTVTAVIPDEVSEVAIEQESEPEPEPEPTPAKRVRMTPAAPLVVAPKPKRKYTRRAK
jgi:hypothetical protein